MSRVGTQFRQKCSRQRFLETKTHNNITNSNYVVKSSVAAIACTAVSCFFTSNDLVGGSWWHRPKADGFLVFKNCLAFQCSTGSQAMYLTPNKRVTLLYSDAHLSAPPLRDGSVDTLVLEKMLVCEGTR